MVVYKKVAKIENFYQNIKLDVLQEKAIFIREDINLDKLSIKNKKIDINQYNFKNLPYRKGVGMMVFNDQKKIFVGKRASRT